MISHKYKCIFVHIPKNAGSSVERAFGFSDIYHQGSARHSPVWRMTDPGYWNKKVNHREYPLDPDRMQERSHHDASYPRHFEEYPSFAICRNPWDRLVSTWKYDQKLTGSSFADIVANPDSEGSVKWLTSRSEFYEEYIHNVGSSFVDFVKNLNVQWFGLKGNRKWTNLEPSKNPNHIPQYHWIKWHMHSQLTFIVDVNDNVRVGDILRFENLSEDWDKLCEKHGWDLELPHTNKSPGKHYTEYYDDKTRDMVARRYAKDIEYFNYKFGD